MDSGLSNFTAKRLKSDSTLSKWLRSVPCLVFYSCSPRNKTFKLWRLNTALWKPTWSLENSKWKRQLFPTGDLRYHNVSIRWSFEPPSYSQIIASSNLTSFSFTNLYSWNWSYSSSYQCSWELKINLYFWNNLRQPSAHFPC